MEAGQLLRPCQLGVATKGGVETLVLSCRARTEDLPDGHRIVQIDFRILSAYTDFCDSNHSQFVYKDHLA